MLTSHGVILGYNGQALVDSKHQVIVNAEAFGNGQDHYHVPPLIDAAKENIKAIGHCEDYFEGKILTADSNYHSPANLKKCEEERLDAYIPDTDFRTRDPRFATQERYGPKRVKKFTFIEDTLPMDNSVKVFLQGTNASMLTETIGSIWQFVLVLNPAVYLGRWLKK